MIKAGSMPTFIYLQTKLKGRFYQEKNKQKCNIPRAFLQKCQSASEVHKNISNPNLLETHSGILQYCSLQRNNLEKHLIYL